MERQTSPNPPEMLSKRLATESKLVEYTSFGKYEKFLVIVRSQKWTYHGGNFIQILFIKTSPVFPHLCPATTNSPIYYDILILVLYSCPLYLSVKMNYSSDLNHSYIHIDLHKYMSYIDVYDPAYTHTYAHLCTCVCNFNLFIEALWFLKIKLLFGPRTKSYLCSLKNHHKGEFYDTNLSLLWYKIIVESRACEAAKLCNWMSSTTEVRKHASWDSIVHHKVWVVSLRPEHKPWFPSWQVLKTQQMSRLQLTGWKSSG